MNDYRTACGTIVVLERRGNKAPARTFILIALRGFIMETEHTQSVVERAYAFVEDMFGLRNETRRGDPSAEATFQAAGLTSEDAMQLDSDAYTFQTVGELHIESRRRVDGE